MKTTGSIKGAGAIFGIFLGAFIAIVIASSGGYFPGMTFIVVIGSGFLFYKLGGLKEKKISDARDKE